MLRSLTTRRTQYRTYDKLLDESSNLLQTQYRSKLTRSRTLPVQVLGGGGSAANYKLSLKLNLPSLPAAKKPNSKSHPIFSMFSRKKRTTSRPEFARYIQYVKEGGIWDHGSAVPVMHYK